MLILGHAGIILGGAVLLSGAATVFRYPTPRQEKTAVVSPDDPLNQPESWLTSLARHVDIRLLLVASLLSDIIDKPLGHTFFRETLSSGRTIGHTLFFPILIAFAGLFLYRRGKKTWLLVVSFCVLAHLILDQMWKTPETLLWPFFGFAFEKHDITSWIPDTLDALATKPEVYIPELVGGLVILWFAWEVLRRRKLLSFIKHGQI